MRATVLCETVAVKGRPAALSLGRNGWVAPATGPIRDGRLRRRAAFDWVFGSALRPKNQFGKKAGLDVSPALATCLHLNGDEMTEWRLVDEEEVPDGPWRWIITQR
jgi:hypothetical protein